MRGVPVLFGIVLMHLASCNTAGGNKTLPGKIAFYSVRNGRAGIYVIDTDATNLRRLTQTQ